MNEDLAARLGSTRAAAGRAALANAKTASDRFRISVGEVGVLRPVSTKPGSLQAGDVARLTAWRNRFSTAFLHEFQATEERTARWLTQIVGPDESKILFMLDDPHGRTVGYMGLAFIDWSRGSGEADAIVRGEPSARGTMTRALHAMLFWAEEQLNLREFGVRVRSDNPALAFYRKAGFAEEKRSPLRRSTDGRETLWTKGGDDRSLELVYMRLSSLPNRAAATNSRWGGRT